MGSLEHSWTKSMGKKDVKIVAQNKEAVMERNNKDNPDRFTKSWWKRVGSMLVQVGKDFAQDSAPQWAAAIAYYALLSVFPLLLAAASIASYFVEPEWAVSQLTEVMGDFVPQGEEEVEDIVQGAMDARGTVGLLSIATLLWSGSRVFSAVTVALNIIYDVDESYGFIKRTAIDFLMLLTIGVLFILGLGSRYLLNLFLGSAGFLPEENNLLFNLGLQVIPGILLFIGLFLTYLYVPRRRVDWKAALTGATAAVALFMIARPVFFQYVEQFGEFHVIYGSVAVIIILVIWAWLMGMILLLGGELVSHIQQMLIEGYSAEDVNRRHKQRSPVAREKNYEDFRLEIQKEIYDQQELDRQLKAYEARNKPTEKSGSGLAVAFSLIGAVFLWLFLSKR
jgi:membrane protein